MRGAERVGAAVRVPTAMGAPKLAGWQPDARASGRWAATALALLLLALVAVPAAAPAWAQTAGATGGEVTEIARGLKCPVCENQSVADSPSPLAVEMRGYIERRLAAGEPREAIVRDLVERYGEGILLDPPRQAFTLLVWWLPIVSLAVGALIVALSLRRWRHGSRPLEENDTNGDALVMGEPELEHYRARLAEELARRGEGRA